MRVRLLFPLAALAASAVVLALLASRGRIGEHTWVFGTYPLALIFSVFALALFVAVFLPRWVARFVGVLATLVFGATGLLVMYHDQIATGSPIMLSLLIPLTVTALLSAVAFWRA